MTTPLPRSAGIFISYRRQDAAYPAGWLFDLLTAHLGPRIFKDVNSIQLGDDFIKEITTAVESCAILLAVIGKQWLAINNEHGRRRLDDPADFVRLEIETALKRGIRVIPVLVDGARMPDIDELPDSLKMLARRQALVLSPDRINDDVSRLLRDLEPVLAGRVQSSVPTAGTGRKPDRRVSQEKTSANPPLSSISAGTNLDLQAKSRPTSAHRTPSSRRDMTQPPLLGGRYELDGVVGRGGMAEVYRARDIRLDRVVAIKTLRADLARDQNAQTRFRQAAQLMHGLSHVSIAAVYDTGEDVATGWPVPYIVMEYVDGRTVRELLRERHRLLTERSLEIIDGVLRALDYSHQAGIAHRNIKPDHVMVTRNGDVKVMDFSSPQASSNANDSGTAQYLSPEQARGERVDSRSDLYSTGCLLFELLTGRPPFTGDSPVAIAYQHLRENPVPPSRVDPDVPPWADAIVLKAMAKSPADRYQTAADMRADLQRAASGMPVAAAPPTKPDEHPSRSKSSSDNGPRGWYDGGSKGYSGMSLLFTQRGQYPGDGLQSPTLPYIPSDHRRPESQVKSRSKAARNGSVAGIIGAIIGVLAVIAWTLSIIVLTIKQFIAEGNGGVYYWFFALLVGILGVVIFMFAGAMIGNRLEGKRLKSKAGAGDISDRQSLSRNWRAYRGT